MLDYQLGESTIQSARSPRAVSVWSAFLMPFLPFLYGYPSSSPRAHNKSVPTLRYTRRHGPIYTGHACRHLLSAVPWISKDRLFVVVIANCFWWIFSKYLHGFSKFFSFVYCQLPGKNPVLYLWKDTVMTWGVVLKAFSTPAHTAIPLIFFWQEIAMASNSLKCTQNFILT